MTTKHLIRTQTATFESPKEVRTFDKGLVELVEVDGRMVGRATFQPGWVWSKCVGSLAGTPRCEAAHFGYQLTGTMRIISAEGEYDIHAGDVFSIPPGHDGYVVGDEPVVCVDFQGMADYAKAKSSTKKERPGRRH